jgi:chemotaxis signal transduction protein
MSLPGKDFGREAVGPDGEVSVPGPRPGGYTVPLEGRGDGIRLNTQDTSATVPEPDQDREGAPPPAGPGYPLLLVRTANYRAGIPVGNVREVLISRRVARVPDAEYPLMGVLSLRGDMVTVFDLAGLQAFVDRDGGAPSASDTTGVTTGAIRPNRLEAVVVIRGGKDALGLVVEGVEDIRDFRPSSEEGAAAGAAPAPAPDPGSGAPTLAPSPGRLWAGIVSDGRGEIGVLDANAAMEAALAVSTGKGPGEEAVVSLEVAENGAAGPPGGKMSAGPAAGRPAASASANAAASIPEGTEERRDG